jgi:uncharacterized protein
MIKKQNLEQQLKKAIRSQDKNRVSVLRLLLSAIHNQEIDKGGDLTEKEIGLVIRKEAKNRRESIEAYRQAGRENLQKKEEAELAILTEFIPPAISEKEVRDLVRKKIQEKGFSGQSGFGPLMGQVMNQIGGQADGLLVAKIVRKELGIE